MEVGINHNEEIMMELVDRSDIKVRDSIADKEVCYRCGEKADRRERNENREWTGKYLCKNCRQKDYYKDYYKNIEKNNPHSRNNIMKLLSHRRTGNQNPEHSNTKGDKGEELFYRWKGYTNLNKKLDNYNSRRDFLDEETGEYYQVKIAYYSNIDRIWHQNLKKLKKSITQGFRFKSLFLFCVSKDLQNIDRIYEIHEKEIFDYETLKCREHIGIVENPKDKYGNSIITWYEKYRITNEEELRKVNTIWQKIEAIL